MRQKIGKWTSTSLVLGNMIGSGIFLLPASLAAYGGVSLLGWLVSAAGALLLAKVFASLSRIVPKSGGPYTYSRAGLGDFAGFLVAWGYWISIWCTNAAITVAMLGYLSVFFPILNEQPTVAVALGLSIIWLLTWVNNRGIKNAGYVQLVTTILKIIPLILVTIVGLFFVKIEHFTPFNLSGETNLTAIIQTTTLTLFAFLGVESATIPADNVDNAAATIPRATWIGVWVAIGVYILGSVAVMGVIPPDELQYSAAPFADAARVIFGDGAEYFVAAGAVISTFGALNGWLLMQGQIPLAAAKDGIFPKFFARLNRRDSPAAGIIFSSILASILMALNYSKGLNKAFEFMMLLSTLTVLVPYLFSSASYMILSDKKELPIWKRSSTWIGLAAFAFAIFAVIGSGSEVVLWGFVMLMLGVPFYVFLKE